MRQTIGEQQNLLSKQAHPSIFWSGCLMHTLKLLMHDIVKHRECEWINDLYKREETHQIHHQAYKGAFFV